MLRVEKICFITNNSFLPNPQITTNNVGYNFVMEYKDNDTNIKVLLSFL